MTPVWGCPWHGLVKGGQLTLPNEQVMSHPQPSGEPWQCGSTALIKHPFAPEIVRNDDEQAMDAANGWQWWDRAILSGIQLYGKNMEGWIYIDPVGDCWNVRTSLSTAHLNGGTCTVTLTRFGTVPKEPDSYSYDVIVPSMGQSTPTITGGNDIRVLRFHTSPTGNGAMFEVSVEFREDYDRYWTWRPVGWVEVTLSGQGADCTAEVVVRKTRAQTLGSTSYVDQDGVADNYYLENLPDGTSRVVREVPTSGNNYGALAIHNTSVFVYEGSYSDYVVAMLYDEAGALHELTLNGHGVTDYNDPPLVHTGPTSFGVNEPVTGTWTSNRTATSTLTVTYKLDGVALCSYEYSVTEAITESLIRRLKDGGGTERINETAVSSAFTPGGEFNQSYSSVPTSANIGGSFWLPWFDSTVPPEPRYTPSRAGTSPLWFSEDNVEGRLSMYPVRHSNQIFGFLLWELPDEGANYRVRYEAEVATPAGAATLPTLDVDQGNANFYFEKHAYASYCPVTQQVTRDIEPICYV
ncbi:hypothetical protein NAV33_07210 [Pseudomonas stutzeri]|uniref:hypothetical protein n=1 Tax=Stutzerimonas stutzeri TaxID=316 RepID=UPI00210AE3BF|nr:hypothetical protein [Stutzerimonas stutzeri]MCQ4311682.1 hypothetical protein [Stutzerimonas stutzeri]